MTPHDRKRQPRVSTIQQDERRRAVEELYLMRYRPQEIWRFLRERFPVSRGTIRNDIVAIRKEHSERADTPEQEEVRANLIARLDSLRRHAMKAKNFKLAFELDKEISRLLGLRLESDTQRLTVTMEAARSYVEHICDLIVQNVRDPEDRARLLAAIEAEAGIASTEAPPA